MGRTIGEVHAETFETRISDDRQSVIVIMGYHLNKKQKFSYIYNLDKDQMTQLRDFLNERLEGE